MRRASLFVILALLGLLGTVYFAWSWHRASDRLIVIDPARRAIPALGAGEAG